MVGTPVPAWRPVPKLSHTAKRRTHTHTPSPPTHTHLPHPPTRSPIHTTHTPSHGHHPHTLPHTTTTCTHPNPPLAHTQKTLSHIPTPRRWAAHAHPTQLKHIDDRILQQIFRSTTFRSSEHSALGKTRYTATYGPGSS